MRTMIVVLAGLALFLMGCATPNLVPGGSGTSGVAKGGDADSGQFAADLAVAFAQPGSTAISSPVRNEDRTSNAQAGDSPQLVLGASGKAAFEFLSKQDEVEKAILRGMEAADKASDTARSDALRAELVAYQGAKIERAAAMAGSFDALQQVIFLVVQVKANGVTPERLTAEAIAAAAAGLEAALKPASLVAE